MTVLAKDCMLPSKLIHH